MTADQFDQFYGLIFCCSAVIVFALGWIAGHQR